MLPLPAKPTFSSASPYWLAARDIYRTLRVLGAGNPLAVAAVANADMESAFRAKVVGDSGKAFNLWQWWWHPRGERILAATGIDVRSERDVPKVAHALWWEMTNTPAYEPHFQAMQIAPTAAGAATLFSEFIEGAGAPDAAERRAQDAAWWTVAISEHADFFAPAV